MLPKVPDPQRNVLAPIYIHPWKHRACMHIHRHAHAYAHTYAHIHAGMEMESLKQYEGSFTPSLSNSMLGMKDRRRAR